MNIVIKEVYPADSFTITFSLIKSTGTIYRYETDDLRSIEGFTSAIEKIHTKLLHILKDSIEAGSL